MESASPSETWCLEGTYSEKDIRAFSAFLAGRVAGSRIWSLSVFILLPLLWSGDIRTTWPLMLPIAVVLSGFMLILRFVILPRKLHRASIRLPGVFAPRRITIDGSSVKNVSEAGDHAFRLEEVREVVDTPDHLFVMVTAKQGIPIPKPWIGTEPRIAELTRLLLSRRIGTP